VSTVLARAPDLARTTLRVYTEIRQQRAIWEATEPYLLYCGGRGAGKSHTGAIWSVSRQRKTSGLIVAPTHKNLLGGAMAALLPILYGAGLVAGHNKQEGWYELVDGKTLYFRSLDQPEFIRGLNVSWFWGDELGIQKTKDAWDIILACIRGPGRRQRLVTTTPPPTGERHWLHDTFVKRAVTGIHRVVSARTADNPYLPPDFEGDLRREYQEHYAARELDAQWIDVGAVNVYDVAAMQTRGDPPLAEITRTARACDTAATGGGGDYTAMALLSMDRSGHLYIRDMVRGQWAPAERDQVMLRVARADKERLPEGTCFWVPQERSGAGISQRDSWVRQLVGFNVVYSLETGDKVVRAGPLASQMGAGNVTITRERGMWNNYWHEGKLLSPDAAILQFRYNMSMFPQGRTKDESDALAAALQQIVRRDTGIAIGSFRG